MPKNYFCRTSNLILGFLLNKLFIAFHAEPIVFVASIADSMLRVLARAEFPPADLAVVMVPCFFSRPHFLTPLFPFGPLYGSFNVFLFPRVSVDCNALFRHGSSNHNSD